jgi:hypothetical protein
MLVDIIKMFDSLFLSILQTQLLLSIFKGGCGEGIDGTYSVGSALDLIDG